MTRHHRVSTLESGGGVVRSVGQLAPRSGEEQVREPKRVLIVEDEPGVRRLLGELFSIEGYMVSEASDGGQGLERLKAFRPDVVILDLMMPGVNGWTFAEVCRRTIDYRDLPIIAISAMFDMKSAAGQLRDMGVSRCLAKPFDVEALLAVVDELI
jgi:CheY-like chemotaxis protein